MQMSEKLMFQYSGERLGTNGPLFHTYTNVINSIHSKSVYPCLSDIFQKGYRICDNLSTSLNEKKKKKKNNPGTQECLYS